MTKFFMLYMMLMTGASLGVMILSLYFQYQLYRDTYPRHNVKRIKVFFKKLLTPCRYIKRKIYGSNI